MVKAHSKDNDICYYASLLLAQFEGPEEWSHTTPLPLRVSHTTPLPLHVSYTTPLPLRVSYTTPLPLRVSYTTPLPLRVSYTTPLPLRVSYTTPLPLRVSYTTPLPLYQTPRGSPVWSAFKFPSVIPLASFHVITVLKWQILIFSAPSGGGFSPNV